MSGLRKTLDALASELDALCEKNDAKSHEHYEDGDDVSAQYRMGRAISYAVAARKIREALEAS